MRFTVDEQTADRFKALLTIVLQAAELVGELDDDHINRIGCMRLDARRATLDVAGMVRLRAALASLSLRAGTLGTIVDAALAHRGAAVASIQTAAQEQTSL